MARLQILELPEGSDDNRPPFLLVVDQYEPCRYVMGLDQTEQPISEFDGIAEKIGARTVLVFAGTVDIPANDTSAYAQQVAEEVVGKVTRAVSSQHLADERTDIARDMDRLAKWKNELLDALGMDRTRDWDDIRNAAAGIRKERDAQSKALERLRVGEETVTDERIEPTPGQWIWHWNRATPEKRLSMASQILDGMKRSNDCLMADHEARLAHLRGELERLNAERSAAETPNA
jgi:hypothetical protein